MIDLPTQSRAAIRAPRETRPNEAGTTPAAAPGVSVGLLLLPLAPELEDGLDPSVGVDPPVLEACSLVVEVEVRTTVVEEPTLTTNEEAPCTMVVTPIGRPAGMVATAGCDVTTSGCDVTTAGCDVSAGPPSLARPVMMPSELVCVNNDVRGLEYR